MDQPAEERIGGVGALPDDGVSTDPLDRVVHLDVEVIDA